LTEWQEVNLGQVVEILSSKRVFASDYTIEGVPFWRGKEVVELSAGRSITTELYIAEKTYQFLGRKIGFPKKDDILLTSVGTLGRAYKLTDEDRIYFKDGNLTWFRNYSERLDPSWLLYWMRSDIGQGSFEQTKIGSTQQALTIVNLKSLKVALPPLPEQRAIAATLGALDDKIELNRRMNETLEAMARALFRDWFVDFGPTRAKMAGTAPYLSPDLWSLFPDSLDDAGKPEGWEADTLGAIATARTEGVDPATVSETTPYIGLEHMPRGSIALSEWEGAAKVSSSKGAFEAGDFLFGKLRPYFHKVGVAPVSGICSTDIVVVRPSAPSWRGFVIACISDADFVAYTDKTSTGTKMPRTSWRIMSKYPATLPSIGAAEAFDALVAPMLGRIRANILEFRTLAQTRDLLLPRLMSGELRVAGAEHAVEAVL